MYVSATRAATVVPLCQNGDQLFRSGFLHSVISLTECIGIVRVGKYRVVCLFVCVSMCVCVSVCVCIESPQGKKGCFLISRFSITTIEFSFLIIQLSISKSKMSISTQRFELSISRIRLSKKIIEFLVLTIKFP